MTVHLLKLCVGVDTVQQLEIFQSERRERLKAAGVEALNVHVTRNRPRRAESVLDGGSLYWVIRREIRVRQRILRMDVVRGGDGVRRCGLVLAPKLVRVEARARRPFQGWRYLEAAEAPADLASAVDESDDMPEAMRRELRELGLI